MSVSSYRLAGMDCSAEEQIVRMTLSSIDGVEGVAVDLEMRTVTVTYDGDPLLIADVLDSLDMDMTRLEQPLNASAGPDEALERRVLVIALVINAGLFIAEFAAGLISRSMGLLADSLDMLADATVYTLSLVAVGGSSVEKRRLATASGFLQLGLAFVGLFEVGRRFLTGADAPDYGMMVAVSLVALAGNTVTILVLRRAKSPEAHFQASWIFTANDIKVNALVIASAIIVALTGNATADLVVGAAIFAIVANGARRILRLARS
jgi:Co/Zn/Cd efflux system component